MNHSKEFVLELTWIIETRLFGDKHWVSQEGFGEIFKNEKSAEFRAIQLREWNPNFEYRVIQDQL